MPRTRRTVASDAAGTESSAADDAQTSTEQVTDQDSGQAETNNAALDSATDAETAAKPARSPRRRAPRKPREAAAESTTDEVVGDEAAQLAEDSTVESEPKSKPSRRRRTPSSKSAEPIAEIALPVELVSESDDDTESPNDERRRGRSRRRRGAATPTPVASVEAIEDFELVPLETAPTEVTELPVPVRRGRSRRRREIAVVAAEEESIVADEEAEEADIAEVDAEASPEEGGRKNRRRRQNRRRSMTAEELIEASETILLVDAEEEIAEEPDDLDLVLPLAPPIAPSYVAPKLVPEVEISEPPLHEMRVSAAVKVPLHAGIARVQVKDESLLPYFLFVNAEAAENGEVVDSQIRLAAAAGIHLFSGVMYVPLKNAYGDRPFGPIDALVQHILANDPDGYLIPRLQFVPTNYWLRTHPDQIATYADGSEGDVSLASTDFWDDCVEALDALITHFADPQTPGGDRVIGFHIDRGEWFYDVSTGYDVSEPNTIAYRNWLKERYQQVYALRAAWHDGSVTFETAGIPAWIAQQAANKSGDTPLYLSSKDRRWVDYSLYSSELVAQAITGLASAVKKLSDRHLLVGVSYGYTLEFAARNDSGHLAMTQLLNCDDIDILAGPNAYSGRGAGNPASFGAAIDSVRLHNKLWVVEDDTKTFLADKETDDTYNPKIVSGADTQAAHQRHFGAALAHQAGVSWMDLWGQGWLDSEDVWQELGGLTRLADKWDKAAAARSGPRIAAPDVVVFVDEASLCLLRSDTAGLGSHLIVKTRDLLLRSGANVGFYLQSDLTHPNLPEASLYLFLNALRLTIEEKVAIREKLQQPGKTLCWLYAPGIFDEHGAAVLDAGDVVGITLRAQPWNTRLGSQIVDPRHPITERLNNVRRIGQDETISPSYSANDPQAVVLAEYTANGAPSLAVREHSAGWKSVFLGEPHLTIELLRGIYNYAGVPVYETQDDVLYASSDGILLVHAPYAGQRVINLPQEGTVYDAMEHKIIAVDAKQFRIFLRARTTRLFFIGSTEEIVATTGLPLPPPSARTEPEQEQRREQTPQAQTRELPAEKTTVELPEESENSSIADVRMFLAELAEGAAPLDDDYEGDGGDTEPANDSDSPAPRSRWQRRRAAARARREAERQARQSATSANGETATALDLGSLLPNLPPRKTTPPQEDVDSSVDNLE
jgi:hypothetical protein